MNNVYENNMRLLPFLKFVETYKRLIVFLSAVVIIGIGYFAVSYTHLTLPTKRIV